MAKSARPPMIINMVSVSPGNARYSGLYNVVMPAYNYSHSFNTKT